MQEELTERFTELERRLTRQSVQLRALIIGWGLLLAAIGVAVAVGVVKGAGCYQFQHQSVNLRAKRLHQVID